MPTFPWRRWARTTAERGSGTAGRRLGLGLLAAAVWAGPPASAAFAAPACTISTEAILPLSLRNGHYVTTARIDGKVLEMLVDTGSAVSTVDPRVAAALRLAKDGRARSTIIGAGGRGTAATVAAKAFDLGDIHLGPVTLLAKTLSAGSAAPSGLIGADLLARFDVEFDPFAGRLVLHGVTGCSGQFLDWDEPTQAIPLRRFFDGRLKLATLGVNDTDLSALVDTGSTQTVLFKPGARRLGAAAAAAAGDRRGFGTGAVPGQRVPMFAHRFASLRLGTENLDDLLLIVADASPLNLEMILGLDLLARRRIWLSYATDQMFVSTRAMPAPKSPP